MNNLDFSKKVNFVDLTKSIKTHLSQNSDNVTCYKIRHLLITTMCVMVNGSSCVKSNIVCPSECFFIHK